MPVKSLTIRGFVANETWVDSSDNIMPTWREVAKETVSDTGYVSIPSLVGLLYEFESYEKIVAAMGKMAATISKEHRHCDWVTVTAYDGDEALLTYELNRAYPGDVDWSVDDFDPRYYTKPGYC